MKALLEGVAERSTPLRDLVELSARDIGALAGLAAIAIEAKKFDCAARIFAGLEVLEPECAIHTLHRAHAEAENGLVDEALLSVTRFIEREDLRPPELLIEALTLRARLHRAPELAAYDRAAADALAGRGSR